MLGRTRAPDAATDTAKTFTVTTMEDMDDEILTLSDPLARAWLARFGRTAAGHVGICSESIARFITCGRYLIHSSAAQYGPFATAAMR